MKARYVASVGIAVALDRHRVWKQLQLQQCQQHHRPRGDDNGGRGNVCDHPRHQRGADACTSAASVAPAANGAKCANGKLTVWLMSDAQTGWADAVKSANDSFATAVPGCTADVQYQSWGTYQDKLTAAINAGQAPDVVEFGNSQTTKWIAGNALSDATAAKASFDNCVDLAQRFDDLLHLPGQDLVRP